MEKVDGYSTNDAWEDAAQWMRNFRAAHPDDDRDEVEIFMSDDYGPDPPYWPRRISREKK